MRYAVVTGATKGIGRAVAESFLQDGFFVIGNFSSDEAAAEEFLEDNAAYADRTVLIKQELSSYETADMFAQRVIELAGAVDVLVVNHGTTDITPFEEITKERWARVMEVNLTAVFFLIQKLSASMRDDGGRIILMGSVLADFPHARSVPYGVSKAAVHSLAQYLVKYFAPRGITVNAVAPGFVDTPWQAGKAPEHRKRIEDKVALHRFARPEEIASLCRYLMENQYINGAIIKIDGGYCFE